ncbi:MAG: site-specific integrase, partial [Myxococcota bacterium]|nr:site-specific integrase [Myxococcota bacterium]
MVRKSTGIILVPEGRPGHSASKREAKARAAEIRTQVDAADLARAAEQPLRAASDRPAGHPAPVPLSELKKLDLIRARAKGVSDKQIRALTDQWDNHLLRILGPDTNALTLTYDDLVNYIATRRQDAGHGGKRARGQSIRRERQALFRGLAAVRRRLKHQGIQFELPEAPEIKDDPADRAQKGKLHPPEVLAKWLDELRTLEAEECHHSSLRRGALAQAEVALFSGLRSEEMERLTVEWLEQAAPEVREQTGYNWMIRLPEDGTKTHDERLVGVPEFVARDIVALWKPGMPYEAPLLAGNHRRAFRNAARRIGYTKTITPRDLRHCFGTLSAQGTGDARATQAALGHADLRTTQRYLSATQVRTVSASKAVVSALTQAGLQPARHSAHQQADSGTHRHTDSGTLPGTPKEPISEKADGLLCIGNRGGWTIIELFGSIRGMRGRSDCRRWDKGDGRLQICRRWSTPKRGHSSMRAGREQDESRTRAGREQDESRTRAGREQDE